MRSETIKTQRLLLAPVTDKDRESVLDILLDEEVGKTYMVPEFSCREDAVRIFEVFKRISHEHDRLVYGVFLDGALIGLVNDVGISRSEVELGYVIATAHKNQGYATEVLEAAIKEAFDRGLSTVVTGAFEDNTASIRVMQKCGMSKLDKDEIIEYRGVSHRCIYYSIDRA